VTSNIETGRGGAPAASGLSGGLAGSLSQQGTFAELCGAYLSSVEGRAQPSTNPTVSCCASQVKGGKEANPKMDQTSLSRGVATEVMNIAICMLPPVPLPAVPVSEPIGAVSQDTATPCVLALDSVSPASTPRVTGVVPAAEASGKDIAAQPSDGNASSSLKVAMPSAQAQPFTAPQISQRPEPRAENAVVDYLSSPTISSSPSATAPAEAGDAEVVQQNADKEGHGGEWGFPFPSADRTSGQISEITVKTLGSTPLTKESAVTPVFVSSRRDAPPSAQPDAVPQTEMSPNSTKTPAFENHMPPDVLNSGRTDGHKSSDLGPSSLIRDTARVLLDPRNGKQLAFAVRASQPTGTGTLSPGQDPSLKASVPAHSTPTPTSLTGATSLSTAGPSDNMSNASVTNNLVDTGVSASVPQFRLAASSTPVGGLDTSTEQATMSDSTDADSNLPEHKQTLPDSGNANPAATNPSSIAGSLAEQNAHITQSIPGSTTRATANDSSKASDSESNLRVPVEPAAHAVSGPAQLAQMTSKAAQSEMRIGLNTAAFGKVQVRTVIHASEVGVQIGSEKGDLRNLIANDLPGIANTLQQQNLRLAHVSFQQQGFASSADSSSSGGNPQPRSFAQRTNHLNDRVTETSTTEPASPADIRSAGRGTLSILA